MIQIQKASLSTGVTMNVALAGADDAPPVILLHGFPESHRTWRGVAPLLADRFRLIMPDLRGFGASDRPQDVAAYATDTLVADIFALADAMDIDRFALVGHDWGGAIAWAAALRGNRRIERLGIVNSPHPWIFQKTLIEDAGQRAASQYITAFRAPGMEAAIEAMGYDAFFDKSFSKHVDLDSIPAGERARYIVDWSRPGALTAMLNWYRASHLIVPPPGPTIPLPDWVVKFAGRLRVPVQIIWGLDDKALLPVQLESIGEVGDDVEVVPLKGVGHFAPWQAPDQVAAALAPFLGRA
ncbi:MAG: alpha/beta fold hydrolase [Sphingomonas sp.]|uniref:alpha/beta fold hydrolase n=1 Tax=Sphingomonas sp. TaxID=28214 RepID=UPI00181BAE60|nr:alpha/beta fold hydrolase [Sphingomonas sp.]MBA3667147.1 alpha/beta fold hydrolase [Sphingomonas sp.]